MKSEDQWRRLKCLHDQLQKKTPFLSTLSAPTPGNSDPAVKWPDCQQTGL